MAIKQHRFLNLYRVSDNRAFTIAIGSIKAIENDYTNGGEVAFGDCNILYDFCKDHVGDSFRIQNLNGLYFDVLSEYNDAIFSDPALSIPAKSYKINIRCTKKSGKDYANTKVNVRAYNNNGAPFYSERSYITGNQETNNFGQCFVWDETNNNLYLTGFGYTSLYSTVTGNYQISPGKNIGLGPRFIGKIGIKQELTNTVITPSITTINADIWKYIFTNYPNTDNDDKDDTEKQKPEEWSYPNGPGGPSKPGGGDGDQDDTSEPITEDDIIDGLSSDFVKLYKITKANLTALSEYMLQDDFLTNIKKLYADPMDAIISLNTFPINATGTAGVITTSGVSTGINAVQINNTIIDIDCGTVSLKEYWGSFLDYETKISLFLPYVGIQAISTDDFMNDIIHVVYRVDLLSGGFVVFVKNSRGIVHQTTGNMAYHMPVTSIDYSRMYSALITGAVGIAGNAAAGNASGVISGTMSTIQNFHPQIQMSGNFGGNTGICSNKKPYLIIERPVPNVPSNYSAIKGNTSNVTVTLGNCSGFTQISDMQIKYISATDEEKTQILNLLTSGVYF